MANRKDEDEPRFNGWLEYKQRVLFQLEQLTDNTDHIDHKIDTLKDEFTKKFEIMNTELTVLKTKSIMYGTIAGFMITIIVEIVLHLVNII